MRRLLILALVLLTLLSVWNVLEIRRVDNRAERLCLEANNLRSAQRGLGQLLSELPAQDPRHERQLEGLRDYANSQFARIDCD